MTATKNVDPKDQAAYADSVFAAEKWADVAHRHPSGPTPAVRDYLLEPTLANAMAILAETLAAEGERTSWSRAAALALHERVNYLLTSHEQGQPFDPAVARVIRRQIDAVLHPRPPERAERYPEGAPETTDSAEHGEAF